MTIRAFLEGITRYWDLMMTYEDGDLRNFSELYDLNNFYVNENTVLEIMQFSTYQVVELTGHIYWRMLSLRAAGGLPTSLFSSTSDSEV